MIPTTRCARYYQTGELYAYRDEAAHPLGMVLALPKSADEVELKAVAVDAAVQGRGIGQQMVKAVLAQLHRKGVRRVIVWHQQLRDWTTRVLSKTRISVIVH
jgi:N-acetylglutamate synthase-like GNAT family acetyltransferase